jgi:hypothetical protein
MRLLIAVTLLVKLASVYMITHWIIWRKSTDTPALGFIEPPIIPDVGRNKACQKIPDRDPMVLRDRLSQIATISAIYYRNTCATEKHSSARKSAYKSAELLRTADATLNRSCQDCELRWCGS